MTPEQLIDRLFAVSREIPPERRRDVGSPPPFDEELAAKAREALQRGEAQTTSELLRELRIELAREAIATATAELREQLAAAERRARESQYKMFDAYTQLEYLWSQNRGCPCGARPESPNTHPHVTGCPTAAAIAAMKVGG